MGVFFLNKETEKEKSNISQNYSRRDNFRDIPEKILKIYLPDHETIARELWRIKEYAEELDKIQEEIGVKLNEGSIEEELRPEFSSGAEYLDWLVRKLPHLEPFLPENAEHVYFFRRWSRDDFRYYAPWLETLYEGEPWNDVSAVNDEDDNKPEYASGEEYLGWLGRQLPCLQPFLPQNAEHFYFRRRWSRNDIRYYAHYLDTHLEEDTGESLTGANDEEDIESESASGLGRQLPCLKEENENKEYNECGVNGHDKDTKELEDEVIPYIRLMLQPTVFSMDVLENPLSLVEICTKSIPAQLTRDISHIEDETTLRDQEQPTEQKCQKARKRISSFKFKFLCRNRKDREDKKRAPGFLSRFFR